MKRSSFWPFTGRIRKPVGLTQRTFWVVPQSVWRLGLFGLKMINNPNSSLSATKLFILFVHHILKSPVLPAKRFRFCTAWCTVARVDKTKAQLCRFRLEVTCWPTQQVSQHLVLSHSRHSPSDQHRLVLLLEMVSWQCQQTPELRISPLIHFFFWISFSIYTHPSHWSAVVWSLCVMEIFQNEHSHWTTAPHLPPEEDGHILSEKCDIVNLLHTLLFHF